MLFVIVLVIHWSSNCTNVCHTIQLYKEVPVRPAESDPAEFYQRLRKQGGGEWMSHLNRVMRAEGEGSNGGRVRKTN